MKWIFAGVAFVAAFGVHAQDYAPSASSLVGLYVQRSGFNVTEIELKNDGELVMRSRDDAGGRAKWIGVWWCESSVVQVVIPTIVAGKRSFEKYCWVPLIWGDQRILVEEEELTMGNIPRYLREEAVDQQKGKKVWTRVAIRVTSRLAEFPARYGPLRAPKAYAAKVSGISANRRKPKAS